MIGIVVDFWDKHPRGRSLLITVFIAAVIVAIVGGGIAGWLQWEWLRSSEPKTWLPSAWKWLGSSEDGKAYNGDILRNVGFIVAGVVALAFALWRALVAQSQARAAHGQAQTAQQSLLNERYQRGAEMLGSPVPSVRLGGIFALQRLAEERPEQYHVQVMRLLCAFVKDPDGDAATYAGGHVSPVRIARHSLRQDVQAAVEGISTLLPGWTVVDREPGDYIDLRGSRLSGIRLEGGDLSGVDLTDAELVRADLENTNIRGAILTRAQLQDSNLRSADLTGTNMVRTNLAQADLSHATLDATYLIQAILDEASFDQASLAQTWFSQTQVRQSQLDQTVPDPDNPPLFFGGATDPETGEPLVWHGNPFNPLS